MYNKKGQGLSTNAIILIILGVVVLVMLIYGFMTGWDFLKKELIPENNVNSIKQSCKAACISESNFDFCSKKMDLNNGTDTIKDITCEILVKDYTGFNYGIEACSSITCEKAPIVA